MKKIVFSFLLTIAFIAPSFAQEDAEGGKDPVLFSRMPGFHIYRFEDIQFDKFEFQISSNKTQSVEGHHTYINYYLNENAQTPGALQIARNYTNAIKKIGGQVENRIKVEMDALDFHGGSETGCHPVVTSRYFQAERDDTRTSCKIR